MITRIIGRTWAALLFSVAIAGATTASAQNYEGTGQVRLGVFGYYGMIDADARITENAVPPPIEYNGTTSLDAIGGGISAGYDLRVHGPWVVGVEADLSIGDHAGRYRTYRISVDYLATLRARLGLYVHPDMLLYATAGVAWTGASFEFGNAETLKNTPIGWTIGLGAERRWHHVRLFGEYLYVDGGDWTFRQGTDDFRVQFSEHLIRFGLKIAVGHDYHEYRDDHRDTYRPMK